MVDPNMNTAADAWQATLDAAASTATALPSSPQGDMTITATISGGDAIPETGVTASASLGLDSRSLIKLLILLGLGAALIGALFTESRR